MFSIVSFSTLLGALLQETLINQIVSMNRKTDEPAVKAVNKRIIRLPSSAILGKLARILELDPCVLIVDIEGEFRRHLYKFKSQ